MTDARPVGDQVLKRADHGRLMHDLRTPLAVAMARVQRLRQRARFGDGPDQVEPELTAIDAALARLSVAVERVDAVEALIPAKVALITVDVAGTVTRWNRAAANLLGHGASEAVERSLGDMLLGPAQSHVAASLVDHLAAGHEWEGEIRSIRQDSTPVYACLRATPLLQDNRISGSTSLPG